MKPAKRAVAGAGRPPAISDYDLRRLRADIRQPPVSLGYDRPQWTGKLLAEHLAVHYRLALGVRQCRRILNSIAVDRRGASETRPVPARWTQPPITPFRPLVNSDHSNKAAALARIKRICSSGLPLYPLSRALFDVLGDAIPHGANRVLLADDDGRHPDRYLLSSSELAQWGPIHKHFYVDSPPRISGTVPAQTILQGKIVWRHEEVALPHFYRSEGYNECMRHIGFHHVLMINLRDHLGMSGCYPLWRSADMKPFTADDVRFAQAAAPYIAHALSVASRIPAQRGEPTVLSALEDLGQGVIVIGCGGRVIAVDATARAIFQELALFDGYPVDIFARHRLYPALAYIEQTLRSVFEHCTDPWTNPNSPALKLYSHRIGLVLKLRGIAVDGRSRGEQAVVLVEAGELSEHRRQRIMHRYGLTPRLMELTDCIAANLSDAEIAARMGLSKFTVKGYMRRLMDRLEVTDKRALRRFAADLNSKL